MEADKKEDEDLETAQETTDDVDNEATSSKALLLPEFVFDFEK